MDILMQLGLFKTGDAQAGERAEALTSDLSDEADSSAAVAAPEPQLADPKKKKKKKKSTPHGR